MSYLTPSFAMPDDILRFQVQIELVASCARKFENEASAVGSQDFLFGTKRTIDS